MFCKIFRKQTLDIFISSNKWHSCVYRMKSVAKVMPSKYFFQIEDQTGPITTFAETDHYPKKRMPQQEQVTNYF